MFSALAQLSENFIFIYLGLTLFTRTTVFKPLFILITIIGICAARWCAVFPLSTAINWFIRYRSKRRGKDVPEELPYSYQVMLFWAGLRGAVGVALAAGLGGANGPTLQATVLVVVVLTVIVFGGTTARMLEIMGIRTGVVEEIDSDDEFDIEIAANGSYYKSANALGYVPPQKGSNTHQVDRHTLRANGSGGGDTASYSTGTPTDSPPVRSTSRNNSSSAGQREREAQMAQQSLLSRGDAFPSDDDFSDGDLPPAAKNRPSRRKTASPPQQGTVPSYTAPDAHTQPLGGENMTASGAIQQLLSGTVEEQAAWFTQIDEGFIKPKLLLDQNRKGGGGAV